MGQHTKEGGSESAPEKSYLVLTPRRWRVKNTAHAQNLQRKFIHLGGRFLKVQ